MRIGRRITGLAVTVLALGGGLAAKATANDTGGPARCTGQNATSAANLQAAFGTSLGFWQAGDVPHAYPLPDGRVLWILNDSYLNTDAPNGPITKASVFVHNVAVVQTGSCFEVMAGVVPPPLTTPTDVVADGAPATVAAPPTPAAFLWAFEQPNKRWWWAHGGVVDGNQLHIFFTWVAQTGPVGWSVNFEPQQTFIATYDWHTLELLDLRTAPNDGVEPVYGFSTVTDTDFTYLFGVRDNVIFNRGSRDNFVARVPVGQVFAAPTYWNGSDWVGDRTQAVSISTQGSWNHRMTVVEIDHRWVAVAKADDFYRTPSAMLCRRAPAERCAPDCRRDSMRSHRPGSSTLATAVRHSVRTRPSTWMFRQPSELRPIACRRPSSTSP